MPLAELTDLEEINILDYLRFNNKSKKFLHFDSGSTNLNRILIFTTNKNLQLLFSSSSNKNKNAYKVFKSVLVAKYSLTVFYYGFWESYLRMLFSFKLFEDTKL